MRALLAALDGRVGHAIFVSTGRVYDHARPIPFDEDTPRNLYWGEYAKNKIAGEDALPGASGVAGHRGAAHPRVWARSTRATTRRSSSIASFAAGRCSCPGTADGCASSVTSRTSRTRWPSMLGDPRAVGQAYNVTGEECVTQVGFVELIAELMKTAVPLRLVARSGEKAPFGQNLVYDCHAVYTTTGKLRRELGSGRATRWPPGLAHTLAWYCGRGSTSARGLRRGRHAAGRRPLVTRAARSTVLVYHPDAPRPTRPPCARRVASPSSRARRRPRPGCRRRVEVIYAWKFPPELYARAPRLYAGSRSWAPASTGHWSRAAVSRHRHAGAGRLRSVDGGVRARLVSVGDASGWRSIGRRSAARLARRTSCPSGWAGKTLTVVGLGDIGRTMARAARALGMRVLGVNRSGNPVPASSASTRHDRSVARCRPRTSWR